MKIYDVWRFPVADPGGLGGHGPPGPVKISHKKDGHQRQLHRFHVSQPPLTPMGGCVGWQVGWFCHVKSLKMV